MRGEGKMPKKPDKTTKFFKVVVHTKPQIVRENLSRFAAKTYMETMRRTYPKAAIDRLEMPP